MKNTILVNGKRYVCKIWDSPGTFDRYTIVFKGYRVNGCLVIPYIASSLTGSGFWLHGELVERPGRYLGNRVSFESLTSELQFRIIQELTV